MIRKMFAALAGAVFGLAPAASAIAAPHWPQGRLLVLDPTGQGPQEAELYSVLASGQDRRDLHLLMLTYSSPDYSPDGTKFVYAGLECCMNIDIADADGTNSRWVVSGQAGVSSTHWSPAGDWIAYENGGEIWRVNANGYQYGHAAITVPGVVSHLSDAWSPDGQTVAVTDWWDGAYIWLYDAFGDGSTGRRLTAPSSWLPLEMTWSPDGKTITVASDGDLFQVNAKNGTVTRLTDTPDVSESSPVYSPDGAWLAYAATVPGDDVPFVMIMDKHGNSRSIGVRGAPTSWRAWA
jgi:TolB protein